MKKIQKLLGLYFALFLALPAYAFEPELYGSLRLQVEYVEPDNESDNFNSYVAPRDAFSRVGLKIVHSFTNEWSALLQVEVALDLANLAIQSPWEQDEDLRIFKLNISGPLGMLSYGRGWLAYYNQIAYPVDYFSSYYSGFATFTTLRLDDILYYASPTFNGMQFSVATSKDNGSTGENRNQYTVSYTNDMLTLAAGVDDLGGGDNTKILGLSASYNKSSWYLAAKYERFDSDIAGHGWAADGTESVNALVQYTAGKHTLRMMLANTDNYGEFVLHTAWDYHYNKNTTLFFEYYQEQETAAIADARQTTSSGSNSDPADSGGRSLLVGIRYDF
jgi:hypothetical protein